MSTWKGAHISTDRHKLVQTEGETDWEALEAEWCVCKYRAFISSSYSGRAETWIHPNTAD